MLIYKITNDINDKVYIGQTIKSLDERIRNHRSSMMSGVDTHLYNAMRKYGWEHFKFEILVETDNQSTLNELEAYYINKFDSIRHGYNMIPGGRQNPMDFDTVSVRHHHKMMSDEVRKKISESMKLSYKLRGGCSEEHRRHLSENKKQFYNSERGKLAKEKFKKSFVLSEAHFRALNDAKNKSVYCVDEQNIIIQEFTRVRDAANWWIEHGYNVSYKTACNSIKKSYRDNKFVKGLKWIYRV